MDAYTDCSRAGDDQLWRESAHQVHLVIAIVICSDCLKLVKSSKWTKLCSVKS